MSAPPRPTKPADATKAIDLPALRRLYRDGGNVMDHLRQQLGTQLNTEQLVEVSYDLQSGSYVRFVEQNHARVRPYHAEIAGILRKVATPGDSIADVGTGEMTTLAGVAAEGAYATASAAYALDISLSRLVVGMRHARRMLPAGIAGRLQPVASTLFRLPFADRGVDVVWTSHAVEPNGGREVEAVSELARVARRYLVLFEPSYEHNTTEGRARMDRLGYVRGLPDAIGAVAGFVLDDVVRIESTENPLNPTYAYVARRRDSHSAPAASGLRCPLSRGALEPRNGYLYARTSLLAYPLVEEIPILRIEKGISASVLDAEDES